MAFVPCFEQIMSNDMWRLLDISVMTSGELMNYFKMLTKLDFGMQGSVFQSITGMYNDAGVFMYNLYTYLGS